MAAWLGKPCMRWCLKFRVRSSIARGIWSHARLTIDLRAPPAWYTVDSIDTIDTTDTAGGASRNGAAKSRFAEAEVRKWAAAKQHEQTAANSATCDEPAKQNGIYRELRDPYEIRVLEVLPGVGDETLRCHLVHCSVEFELKFPHPKVQYALSMQDLTQPVWYTALSYVWGPPNFEATIECDGQALPITRSLETVLRRFRLPDCSGFMWVDQICINQNDLREKERQIPLMASIYRHALNTIIWLGEGNAESDAAMDLLRKHGDPRKMILTESDPNEFKRVLPPPDDKIWSHVWDLLSRPWFTRVWVIQEFVLSQDPWLVCGASFLPGKALSVACQDFMEHGVARWLMPKLGDFDAGNKNASGWRGTDVFESTWELCSMKNQQASSANLPPLIELLASTRKVQPYNAAAKYEGLIFVRRFPQTAPFVKGQNEEELCLLGLVADTLAVVSDVFCDPDVSLANPTTENTTLISAVEFVLQHSGQITAEPDGLFETLWRTLVANKDNSFVSWPSCTYAEIFSLLLDESTGRSPTLPGQAYSARQKLPEGSSDRLDLNSLAAFPDWQIFQAARIALINALRNRRLGITEAGRLGLFPRHGKVGDTVCVVQISDVPFLLRPAEQSGKYCLVGECYVHGIMKGEVVEQEKARRGQEKDEDGWPGELITLV
ncbi:6e4a2e03-3f34-4a88-b893-88585cdd9405 [Thermothielavioides terrestris]|uniref:6e4a2e03-3f34-4a88-b893-88585cdd9405 n=1 Tax=Thermothielavioides terrestris TaxID=2587410 RepID=A0A3S4D3E2_9PEZI|nr:6e4a2e03-3f34-4a88-b893-88585cdd9405 [Thermothielavioides terrestris]